MSDAPQQNQQQMEGGDSFSLGDVLGIWRKRKWMILGIATSIPLIVGFVFSKRPKVYEATASLVIDSSVPQYLGESFKDVVQIESNWWTAQETLQTELKVLKSFSQGLAVAKDLCAYRIGPPGEPDKQVVAMKRILPDVNCAEKDD